jgi:hypothetical protein
MKKPFGRRLFLAALLATTVAAGVSLDLQQQDNRLRIERLTPAEYAKLHYKERLDLWHELAALGMPQIERIKTVHSWCRWSTYAAICENDNVYFKKFVDMQEHYKICVQMMNKQMTCV